MRLFLLFLLFGLSSYFLGVVKNTFLMYILFIYILILITFLFSIKPFGDIRKITLQILDVKNTQKIQLKTTGEIAELIKALNNLIGTYQKQQEMLSENSKKIIDSERSNRELLNLFADVIYRTDSKERIVYIKQTRSIFGYSNEQLLGKCCFEFIHPEDRLHLKKRLKTITPQDNLPINNYNLRIITKNGEIRHCLLSNRTIFQNGTRVGREGVLRDITYLKELNQKLKNEKEKIEKMYNNLHDSYLALGKVNAQIAALAEINTTFSSNLDWKDKLYYIIESIRAFMKADETLLFVQDSTQGKFVLKHASIDFPFWEDVFINAKSPLIKTLKKEQQVVKSSTLEKFLDKSMTTAKDYKGMLAIPTIINNKVIGVFVVLFKTEEQGINFPTKLALAYTSQMSIALMMSGELDHSLKKIF